MPKSFPHLRLLYEETDAQNKSTRNVQLENQECIYFSSSKETGGPIPAAVFRNHYRNTSIACF